MALKHPPKGNHTFVVDTMEVNFFKGDWNLEKQSLTFKILSKAGLKFLKRDYGDISLFQAVRRAFRHILNAVLLMYCMYSVILPSINCRLIMPNFRRRVDDRKDESIAKFLEIERQFHDNYAKGLDWDAPVGENYSYGTGKLTDVEKYFLELLGDIRGKYVLDIGSGHGNCALKLAQAGAIVTSIDISPSLIAGCLHRAKANNLSVDFKVMNACALLFDDKIFDAIVGFRSIHHLPDLQKFFLEAYRILKLGGILVIVEPQKYNPFVEFGRKYIKNKDTDRTPTEHTMVPSDIRLVKNVFGNLIKKEFYFLAVGTLFFKQILKFNRLYKLVSSIFYAIDKLLWHIPFLRPLYWQVVIRAKK